MDQKTLQIYQKAPPFVPKNPDESHRNGPPQNQYAPAKTPFLQENHLPSPNMLHLWMCTEKLPWLPPFVLNPRMGYPGASSSPPLSTTFKPTIRSVFFGVKTFHCSRLLPSFSCHLPFRSFPVAHLLLHSPPPLAVCPLVPCCEFIHDGLLLFPGAHPYVSTLQ